MERELLVVANTNIAETATVHVVIDKHLNADGKILRILFPFDKRGPLADACATQGVFRTVKVTVEAGEALVIG